MQSIAVRVFEVWKKHKKKFSLILASFLVLVMGLLVLAQNVWAADASLIDGKLTYNGKSFTGPSTMSDSRIPQIAVGSKYYIEDVDSEATTRTIIFSKDDIAVGGSVQAITLEFTPPSTYRNAVGTVETVAVTDKPEEGGETEDVSCTAQAGSFGWVICPLSNFLADMADKLMSVLSEFLEVKTLTADTKSPVYLIWEYMRNLANVVFVIFFLIVIFSQITSLGISNYGIKKVLPRVIIAAVLVNLSYMVCALAVDVSNIFGGELIKVFRSIQESAVAAGATTSPHVGFGEVLAWITGGVAVAGIGLAVAGGFAGLFFLLLPVLFGVIIAIFAAIFTLAARQALVLVLVIVSPLAFVAYLLPNTEGLFKKWKDLLLKMLILYPAFSLIFGAAELAGWVIISGATSMTMVILGLAVQVIPLVFTPILAKLSGSLLKTVGDFARKPFGAAESAVKNWGKDNQATRKAQALASNSRVPYTRLARWLDSNKRNRADLQSKYEGMTKSKFEQRQADNLAIEAARAESPAALAAVRQEIRERNANDNLNERRLRRARSGRQIASGVDSSMSMYERAELANMRTANSGKRIEDYINSQKKAYDEVEVEETLADGTRATRKIKRARNHIGRAEYANRVFENGADINKKDLDVYMSEMGSNYASDANLVGGTPEDVIKMQTLAKQNYKHFLNDGTLARRKVLNDIADRKAYADAVEAAHDGGPATTDYRELILNATENGAGKEENIANVLASAAATIAKDDKDRRADYVTLYDKTPLTADIDVSLGGAISASNANAMDAAIEVMMKRGDKDMVMATIADKTAAGGLDPEMQKRLSDALIAYKAEAAPMWAYAKSLNIRRAKGEPFVDFKAFAADDDPKLGMAAILKDITDPKIGVTQDRTTYSSLTDMIADGTLSGDFSDGGLGFQIKQLRSAATSGQIDGEVLANLNALVLGGIDKRTKRPLDAAKARANIQNYVENMSASQLANTKESTFKAFNDALGGDYDSGYIHADMLTWLTTATDGLKKPDNAPMVDAMNTGIKKKLGL